MANKTLNRTVKVQKGETLKKIAKDYGVTEKEIWSAQENRSLVSKRRQPDQIQPGDLISVPPNAKRRKENSDKILALGKARDTAMEMRQTLLNVTSSGQNSIKAYDDAIRIEIKSAEDAIASLEKLRGDMRKTATTIDFTATLLRMHVDLGRLSQQGFRASKASGELLKKANEKALEILKDAGKLEALDLAAKVASPLKDNSNATVALVGTVADSWDKINSPSFWANTIIQKYKGKSWSKAVTSEIGDEMVEQIETIRARCQINVGKFKALQDAARSQIGDNQNLIKECEARFKYNEQQIAALPPP